jgi:hypothetical protein
MGDPITMLLYSTGLLPTGGLHFFFMSIFMFLSYDNFKSLKDKKILEILILAAFVVLILLDREYSRYGIIILNFALMIRFLKDAILYTAKYYEINFFHFVLVLYELSLILKFISIVSSFYNYTYFYLTTVVEMLLAVFFIFYREDKPKISISLQRKADDLET